MKATEGVVEFIRMADGALSLKQGWNPSRLNKKERELIAKELQDIAEHIRNDEFEDGSVYKRYQLSRPD